MEQSKSKIATESILNKLEFDPDKHGLSATQTLGIAKSYIDDFKELERQQIIDAFRAGAEYGPKAPDQIDSLANLYITIRFNK